MGIPYGNHMLTGHKTIVKTVKTVKFLSLSRLRLLRLPTFRVKRSNLSKMTCWICWISHLRNLNWRYLPCIRLLNWNDLLNLLMTWPVLWPLWRPAKDRYLEDFEMDLFFFTASRLIRPPCNEPMMPMTWIEYDLNVTWMWLEYDLNMTWMWLDDLMTRTWPNMTQVTKHHEPLNWNGIRVEEVNIICV